jgi:hypothetical protein
MSTLGPKLLGEALVSTVYRIMSKTKKLLANLNKLTDSSGVAPTKAEPKVQSYTNRFYTSTPETIHKLPKRYDKAKRRKDEDGDEFIMIDRIYGNLWNEATHLNLSTHVLKAWHKGDDAEMTKAIKGTEKTVIQMFKDCVEEEKAWAKYLFKDGSIIGLNEKLLGAYVEWTANKRLKALGFDPIFDQPAGTNPLPWTQHWLSSKGMQVAPQETEVESYIVGGIKQDVKKGQFSKFKL